MQHLRASSAHQGALAAFYGVAPNLILGFCAPSLFLIHRARARAWAPGLTDFGWFKVCVGLGAVAVTGWETLQPIVSNLVFDTMDIVATLGGALLFLACWPLLRKLIASL